MKLVFSVIFSFIHGNYNVDSVEVFVVKESERD